jgi:hypothetical protein
MTLRCPFCGATLATGRRLEGYGEESGGIFTSQEYECAGCCAAIVYRTISKLFALRETWRLDAAPPAGRVTQCAHPTFPVYECARCASGTVVPAVPVGPCPVPPELDQFADRTKRSREISYLCHVCAARYLRHEHGSHGAPLEVSYWSWFVASSAGTRRDCGRTPLREPAPAARMTNSPRSRAHGRQQLHLIARCGAKSLV